MVGDYTQRPDPRPLEDRKPINVDKDNFQKVMSEQKLALSFDEIIVTIFTSGHEKTLPIWFFSELFRPRDRPITNVVAVMVIAVTLVPIVLAYYLTRPQEERSA